MSRTVLVGVSANMELAMSGLSDERQHDKEIVSDNDYDFVLAGSSFNLTLVLDRSGIPVKLLCTVGNDAPASLMEAEFRRLELDAFPLPLRRKTNLTAGFTFRNGSNMIRAGKGGYLPDAMERGRELIFRQVEQVRPCMTVGTGVQLADVALIRAMFEAGTRLELAPSPTNVLNPGISLIRRLDDVAEEANRRSELRNLLSYTDLLVVNESEERVLREGLELGSICEVQAMAGQGRTMQVLVTRGNQGATLYNGIEEDIPGCAFADAPVLDLTGAGDSFLGSFLVAQLDGKPRTEALQWAAAGAAITISRLGGSSVPTREEIEDFLRSRAQAKV